MRRRFLWRHAASRPLDCRHVGAWLQAYLDGELDDVRSGAVTRHLQDCRRCGMDAETHRELKASLKRGAPRTRRLVTEAETASLERLRRFAERLAAGEIDAHGEVDRLR